MDECGALRDCRYLQRDRDTKFTRSFRAIIASGQAGPLALPARSPNLNAHAERRVRSVRSNVLLFPRVNDRQREGPVRCRERLGGLLRYYHREAT